MLRVLVLSAFLLLSCNPKAQDSQKSGEALTVEFSLPKSSRKFPELLYQRIKTIWAIEDQGNKNVIYGLDRQGKQVADVLVENAENHDWEDITTDAQGNIYIGDFGNNNNDRRNLSILKVDLKDASQKSTNVTQTTTYHYEGQTAFPPKKSHWLYDCEAL